MKNLKELFIVEVVREGVRRAGGGSGVRILDLGCGTANYVPALIKQFPGIEYVGVEPIETFKTLMKAKKVDSPALNLLLQKLAAQIR